MKLLSHYCNASSQLQRLGFTSLELTQNSGATANLAGARTIYFGIKGPPLLEQEVRDRTPRSHNFFDDGCVPNLSLVPSSLTGSSMLPNIVFSCTQQPNEGNLSDKELGSVHNIIAVPLLKSHVSRLQ